MVWYDVCNDYTLELIEGCAPDTVGMEVCEVEAGTIYAFDFEDEGPIYFFGHENLNGFILGGF